MTYPPVRHHPWMTSAKTHIALLRGVNVGGKNRLPMKDLRAIFEEIGCGDVRSYIQSGNVVYSASKAMSKRVSRRAAAAIEEHFGFRSPVITRTALEFERAVHDNPFPEAEEAPKTVHLGFLASEPTETSLATLDPERSPPDRFIVRGREIYLHCPNGVARSKLTTAYFDARLGVVCTMRNYRTVTRLLDMATAR